MMLQLIRQFLKELSDDYKKGFNYKKLIQKKVLLLKKEMLSQLLFQKGKYNLF